MKIVDQVDARAFNGLNKTLDLLGIQSGYAAVLDNRASWYQEDLSITMFDEHWGVVVSNKFSGLYVEYEVDE